MPLKVFVWCVMAGVIGLAVLAALVTATSEKGANAARSVVDGGIHAAIRVFQNG